MKKKPVAKNLDELIEQDFGPKGSPKRQQYDEGFEAFKLGAMLQAARQELGMTQEQLAEKCGTNKAYISKVENNIKEVRLSTLERIVKQGLGGQLQLSISL